MEIFGAFSSSLNRVSKVLMGLETGKLVPTEGSKPYMLQSLASSLHTENQLNKHR